VSFAIHDERERAARLDAVLQVLYLVFNEGYASSSGRPCIAWSCRTKRSGCAQDASCGVPDVPEVAGLLALMLLTDASRDARTGPSAS
jgi:predicted RNA polymerase sigma factor